MSESEDVGCGSDYFCDEVGDDELDEGEGDADDVLSDSEVYKSEDNVCDEETKSASDDDYQEFPRNEIQYVYLLNH